MNFLFASWYDDQRGWSVMDGHAVREWAKYWNKSGTSGLVNHCWKKIIIDTGRTPEKYNSGRLPVLACKDEEPLGSH
ncbi:hypothetical protein RRG08_018413 [Elysia crispata]|uniref:Uncharacterized protein n=1 Tax=Elysia crispata TaxID=231223 RepID=A0AAE1CKT1_9GAST|nr:hypothetical protein RRG08_018413 [Elysia crispata]